MHIRMRLTVLLTAILILLCSSIAIAADMDAAYILIHDPDDPTVVIGYTGALPSALELPNGITKIGPAAFRRSMELISVTIPDSVTTMEDDAFAWCENLEEVHLGASLNEIPSHAFSECTSLKRITIPENVVRIGQQAFDGCTSLQDVTFPDGLTSIGERAFSHCIRLESVRIPKNVQDIGMGCFISCSALRAVSFEGDVSSIGTAAFEQCGLIEMQLPDGLTELSPSLLSWCWNLRHVTVPAGVQEIGKRSFYYSPNLRSIMIPSTVSSIGNDAFRFCSSLEYICYEGTKEEWDTIDKSGSWIPDKAVILTDGTAAPDDKGFPYLRDGAPFVIEDAAIGPVLEGLRIGIMDDSGENFYSVGQIISWYSRPAGCAVTIEKNEQISALGNPVGTGDVLHITGPNADELVTVVIMADVTGSGIMDLAQVVRMAAGLSGRIPLEGAYLLAADLDNSGAVTLVDLVEEARLYRSYS